MAMLCVVLLFAACDKGRMWETPGVKPYEEPLLVMEDETVPFNGGEAPLRLADAADIALPSNMDLKDPKNIAAGKTGYATYCMQCHGKYHDGNGTVGQSFAPLPTDLQDVAVQELGEPELFRITSYSLPGLRHPGLATTIEQDQRWQIAAYIKSLGKR